jgi:heme-degrading monooxygenase HmoA
MYIKWIVCKVPVSSKNEFSSAQEKWNGTKSVNGFIAQAGGWNLLDENDACIISYWESEDALKYFMSNLHNQILSENKQDQFYTSISVNHFNSILLMEGESSALTEAINNAKLLRIADCRVKQNKIEHFEKVQKDIWQPGMRKANGMLGGIFSKSVNDANKYLVSTFWDNPENHTGYVNNILPILREKADVSNDLNTITGKQILLADSWKIINEI